MKDCNQCGRCCTLYSDGGLSATVEEIEFWASLRPDISRFVSNGEIWMDPVTGKQLTRCPWLTKVPNQQKYACDIYEMRPDDCRHYPTTINEMVRDGCEMIESTDLLKPRRAQNVLDRLMADSRPPLEE